MKSLIEIYFAKIAPLIAVPETEDGKPIVTEEEALLVLEQAGQRVLNFCRRADIPPSLRYVVASMARDFLIAELAMMKSLTPTQDSLLDQIDINHVKKIAIGDTEVQLSTKKERGEGAGSSQGKLYEVWDTLMGTYLYDLVHHKRMVFTGHHVVNIYE